jgi:hypothetical protein
MKAAGGIIKIGVPGLQLDRGITIDLWSLETPVQASR